MNDDIKLTEEQLRQATSRSLPADTSLDAETRALREGFLALGAALETAGSQLDEAALIARVQQSCLEQSNSAPAVVARWQAARSWKQIMLSSALAAAALIAIVRIAMLWPHQTAVVIAPPAPGTFDLATLAQPDAWASSRWFDPLDDEIASAQVEMQRLVSRNRGLDGSLSQVSDQIEALSQELFGESL